MSPTIVSRDGRPILSVGAAGGPTIISQTLLAILYVVDFEMPAGKALAMPRFHHQWLPDELRVERSMPEKTRRELEKLGHKLKLVESIGVAQAVAFDGRKSGFTGVSDPRTEGKAGQF